MPPATTVRVTSLSLLLTASLATAQPATVFDARGLSWEERCTVEALQGIVNRSGPRLYLDYGNPWSQKWLDVYSERNGLRYERLQGLPELLQRFSPDIKGLVVYDPDVDGSRYVAVTMAGLDAIIPVAPEVLEGRSPGFSASAEWPGCDFTTAGEVDLRNWRRAANPELEIVPGEGMAMTEGNQQPGQDWSFASYGPLTVDLDRYPVLEVEVGSLEGEGAGWLIKLTWDRNGDGMVSGGEDDLCLDGERGPGAKRWDIAKLAGISGVQRFSHIQLHVAGPKARVLWRRVRFVTPGGEGAPTPPARPLSGYGLGVNGDLRGRFKDSVSAYEFALRELMPRCNRKFAHAVNGWVEGVQAGCGPFAGFDWPVSQQGFVFNLACCPDERQSYGSSRVGGSPAQAAMYERIVAALEAPAQVTGYGEPEDYWCSLLSRNGHYSIHFGDNWSFHKGIPATKQPFKQKRSQFAGGKLDPGKYYVCFMTSEGDTMKGPIPFFYESWFEEQRGAVANNWGINPLMATQFPGMLEYFYETGTENDYFFAGCSGAGYVYPDVMPNLEQFAEHTRDACRLADIDCIDMWGGNRRDVVQRYSEVTGPTGLTINAGPARLSLLADGTPIAYHELAYWQSAVPGCQDNWTRPFGDDAKRAEAVKWVVKRIETIAAGHYAPFIILVYGDLHNYAHHCQTHAEIAAALDPARFEVARLDDALASVRAWAGQRVLVGAESLNERLAWAVAEGVPTTVPLQLTNGRREAANVEVGVQAGGSEFSSKLSIGGGQTASVAGLTLDLAAGAGTEGSLTLKAPGQDERHPVDLTVVPLVNPPAELQAVAVWSAVDLRHGCGQQAADTEGMRGRAWVTTEPGQPGAHVLFGPYADLPAGEYIVAFRLKLEASPEETADLDPEASIATLDFSAGGYKGLGKSVAVADLRVGDFRSPGEWEWFALRGEWPGDPSQMETRVWWPGKARLAMDRVAVFRVP